MENDYAILRRYEGRASLGTFLAVVFEHLLADQRVRQYGKWYASAEATRLGAPALLLERLLYRERRELRDAISIVQATHPELSARELEAMAARFPERSRRAQAVDVESIEELPVAAPETADARVVARDAQRLSDRAADVVRRELASFTIEDRTLLRFRFARDMSIADISRMMRLPQRPLYRRLESLLGRLRSALTAENIAAGDVAQIIASSTRPPDFGFATDDDGKSDEALPSKQKEPQ
ncbi:MAG TPA: hypothetical protein VF824_16295 [Thermoanaerobaculia bacterium]